MTTVATHVRRLADLEGFDVVVKDMNGEPIDVKSNGVLVSYGYEKMMKHSATVADWKRVRFLTRNAGYKCDVLLGDGQVAKGNMLLSTVRESYEDDE